MYSHEMTLQREKRCCNVAGTEKRRKNDGGVAREHRRAHSEAENNITETVIHEHPGTEISLSSSLQNASPLHGEFNGWSFGFRSKVYSISMVFCSLLVSLKVFSWQGIAREIGYFDKNRVSTNG